MGSNLNLLLRLLFYPNNNNLPPVIYCKNVMHIAFLLLKTWVNIWFCFTFMFLSSKNTKKEKEDIKIQDQIRSKKIQWNTCIMGFQTISRCWGENWCLWMRCWGTNPKLNYGLLRWHPKAIGVTTSLSKQEKQRLHLTKQQQKPNEKYFTILSTLVVLFW